MASNAACGFIATTCLHPLQLHKPSMLRNAFVFSRVATRYRHRAGPWRFYRRKIQAFSCSSHPHQLQKDIAGVDELKQDLEGLRAQLAQLVDQGEEEVAKALIDANYKVLTHQLDGGAKGIEQAGLLDVLAQGHLDMGDTREAMRLLTQLTELMRPHQDNSQPAPLVDKILEHMAAMYKALDQPEQAVALYERCIRIQEALFNANDSPLLVNALFGCAAASKDAGDLSKSTEMYVRAIAILDKSNGLDSEVLVLPLLHLGLTLLENGNYTDAEDTLTRGLKLAKKQSSNGRTGAIMSALAQAKYMAGDNEVSAGLFREALRLLEKSSVEDSILIEVTRADFGAVLTVLQRHKEAQEVLEENLRDVQRRLGPSDISLFVHMKNLAVSHANSGELVKCESLMRRCLQLATAHYGPKASELCGALEMLATLLHHMDKDGEAEPLARQSLQLCEARYGKEHPLTGDACNCLAAILFSLQRFPESHALMNRVLEIQTRELGPKDPLLCQTLESLVALNSKLGKDTAKFIRWIKDIKGDAD